MTLIVRYCLAKCDTRHLMKADAGRSADRSPTYLGPGRVANYIDPDEIIEIAQALIRVPSGTFEEDAAAEALAAWMARIGLDVEIQEVFGPAGRSSQTIGRLRGTGGGRTLLFCGHLDTWASRREGVWQTDDAPDSDWQYFQPDAWTKPPFAGTVEDGWLYGVGALDQKSGIAAMTGAAAALARAGLPLRGDLIVAGVAAEGAGGYGAAQCVRDIEADYAVLTEFTNLDLVTVSVGGIMGRLRVEGETRLFPPRIDPIEKMLSILSALGPLNRALPLDGWLSFHPDPDLPGYPALAIREVSSTLGSCTIRFDLRTVPGVTQETLRTDITALLDQLRDRDPELRVTAEIPAAPFIEWPAVQRTDEGGALARSVSRWHKKMTGSEPVSGAGSRLGAVSDKGHLVLGGIAEVVEYGPGLGEPWPLADERCQIKDLVTAARVLTLTAAELCS